MSRDILSASFAASDGISHESGSGGRGRVLYEEVVAASYRNEERNSPCGGHARLDSSETGTINV